MTYVSLQKSQLLDSLENQVLYADLCTVIIGEEGLGKSFFIKALNSRMAGQVSLSQIDALAEMSVAQLEKSISLQLGLSWSESDNLVERIKERFDQRVLLTIDDAHLLPLTCLEFLMMLVEEQLKARDTHIFIVLAGNATLAEKLNQTSVLTSNPNICVVFELQPIEQQETKHLVANFQAIDVGTTEALYDDQKLGYFFQLSKGNPGELNYQLNRWLSESSVKVEAVPAASPAKKYVLSALYSVIAIGLVLVLVYQEDINRVFEDTSTPNKSEPQQMVETQQKSDVLAETPTDLEASVAQNDFAEETAKQNSLETPERKSAQKPKAQTQFDPDKTTDLLAQEKSESEAQPPEQNTKKPPSELTTNKLNQPASQINDSKVVPKITEDSDQYEFTADEKMLRSFSDQQYTLQWVGVSSLEAAEEFRRNHPLKEQMLIFRRRQESKLLYLVVSGQFNNRDDADHSRIIYKKRGYPGSPWIKSAAAVKADISSLQ